MFSYKAYLQQQLTLEQQKLDTYTNILYKLENNPFQSITPTLTQQIQKQEIIIQNADKDLKQKITNFPSSQLQALALQKDQETLNRVTQLTNKTKGLFSKNLTSQEEEELRQLSKLPHFYIEIIKTLKKFHSIQFHDLCDKLRGIGGLNPSNTAWTFNTQKDTFMIEGNSDAENKIVLQQLQFFEQAKKELGYTTKDQIFGYAWTENTIKRKEAEEKIEKLKKEIAWHTTNDKRKESEQIENIELTKNETRRIKEKIEQLNKLYAFYKTSEGQDTYYQDITDKEQDLIKLYNLHFEIQAKKEDTSYEPLNKLSHRATDQEIQILLPAMRIAVENAPPNITIYAPASYRVIETDGLQAYAMGNTAYISRGYLTMPQYLPLIVAYLAATLNTRIGILDYESQNPYYIITARQLAHPYDIPTLTSYRNVEVFNNIDTNLQGNLRERTEMIGIKTNATGTPEDIRPQPLDILTGGGHNFSHLSYSVINFMGKQGQDTTHKKGYQALDLYLKDLPAESSTRLYFRDIENWKNQFRRYQRMIDALTSRLGQGNSLIGFISQMQTLIPSETHDRINFHYSGAERIQFLKEL